MCFALRVCLPILVYFFCSFVRWYTIWTSQFACYYWIYHSPFVLLQYALYNHRYVINPSKLLCSHDDQASFEGKATTARFFQSYFIHQSLHWRTSLPKEHLIVQCYSCMSTIKKHKASGNGRVALEGRRMYVQCNDHKNFSTMNRKTLLLVHNRWNIKM